MGKRKRPAPWSREEDMLLRKLAGTMPAEQIGMILGRPKNGVHHRIKHLGLDGRLHGEAHWNAKMDNLTAGMVGALNDAGYTPSEIHRFLTTSIDITRPYVEAVCAQRYRRKTAA